jgi:hypothetical protein|mmetsp:Transcript_3420/g.8454  ORF Transcript_3420/g.8454 Transcript_3420/m.8454 type:complete len:138 (-) Transcript_3420:487-900(-)
MPDIALLRKKCGADVRFVFVYVAEAHAADEWPISSGRYNQERGPVMVNKPGTQAERVGLAQRMIRDFPLGMGSFDEVVVDDIEAGDQFENAYAPWPFRFWGVRASGVVDFVAHPQHASYDFSAIQSWVMRAGAGKGE